MKTENKAIERQSVVNHFHQYSKVSRREVFGANDPKPMHLPADAETMFAGYVGRNYQPGKLCLIAINPGGGGDAYVARTAEDEKFYPLLAAFRQSSADTSGPIFEQICAQFELTLPQWNLWRIVKPVLDAAGFDITEIAYLNAVPYRTRQDAVPSVAAKTAAWQKITGPSLGVLRPGMVVALGKKAGDVLARFHSGPNVFCVPRTIGDSYVSEQASVVLQTITKSRT